MTLQIRTVGLLGKDETCAYVEAGLAITLNDGPLSFMGKCEWVKDGAACKNGIRVSDLPDGACEPRRDGGGGGGGNLVKSKLICCITEVLDKNNDIYKPLSPRPDN